MRCRLCSSTLNDIFVDLGEMPVANNLLAPDQLDTPEPSFPLRVYVCSTCLLVQTEDYLAPGQIFHDDYPYFSSYAQSWLDHAERFVDQTVTRFGLGSDSLVIELASNDGYLLRYVKEHGIPCLGVEPVAAAAAVAEAKGIPTLVEFFGRQVSEQIYNEWGKANLIVANNVLAHVPDPHDFVAGIANLLHEDGIATFEFPHLLRLVEDRQFDTIYHEHYSYLSLGTVTQLLNDHDLEPFDVDQLTTHGGSLRLYAKPKASSRPTERSIERLSLEEESAGMNQFDYYTSFEPVVERIRSQFLDFLAGVGDEHIAAFGAAAKGNTFLNYCGVGANDIAYVVDDTPSKQGKYLPGSRIPVVRAERLAETQPAHILILPWNLALEIGQKLAYSREWGARFVTCIPQLTVW